MKKPNDYYTYFNEDNSVKENPYADNTIGITDFNKSIDWGKRQNDIKYCLMNSEEQERYIARIIELRARKKHSLKLFDYYFENIKRI